LSTFQSGIYSVSIMDVPVAANVLGTLGAVRLSSLLQSSLIN